MAVTTHDAVVVLLPSEVVARLNMVPDAVDALFWMLHSFTFMAALGLDVLKVAVKAITLLLTLTVVVLAKATVFPAKAVVPAELELPSPI